MLKLFENSLKIQDYLVLGAILLVLILVIVYLIKNRCNTSCDGCTKQGCKKSIPVICQEKKKQKNDKN